MNLFRSVEHVDRWRSDRVGGATVSVGLLCDLAHAWWGDRLDAAWRPRDRAQNQAILDDLGLVDDFWRLP